MPRTGALRNGPEHRSDKPDRSPDLPALTTEPVTPAAVRETLKGEVNGAMGQTTRHVGYVGTRPCRTVRTKSMVLSIRADRRKLLPVKRDRKTKNALQSANRNNVIFC